MPTGVYERKPRKSRVTMPPPELVNVPQIPPGPLIPDGPPSQAGAKPPTQRRVKKADERSRWVALDGRMREHLLRQKAKRRTPLDLRVDEFEAVLDLSERFDESVQNVLRTCFRIGLADRQAFASHAAPGAAFALGDWKPRPPSGHDPTGRKLPGPVQPPFSQPPPVDQTRVRGYLVDPLAPPRPSTVVESFDEPVFAPAPKPDRRFLPSAPQLGDFPTSEELPPDDAPAADDPAFVLAEDTVAETV